MLWLSLFPEEETEAQSCSRSKVTLLASWKPGPVDVDRWHVTLTERDSEPLKSYTRCKATTSHGHLQKTQAAESGKLVINIHF